jgi:hypothetical protein
VSVEPFLLLVKFPRFPGRKQLTLNIYVNAIIGNLGILTPVEKIFAIIGLPRLP